MSAPRPKVSTRFLAQHKVGPESRFYIDYAWWDQNNISLEAHLRNSLGSDIPVDNTQEQYDTIDPHTGEVRTVSGFEYTLQAFFRQLPANFYERLSLVDACFVVLLANGNRPMRATEIAAEINHAPETIYLTLRGPQIHRGIRPYIDV